MSLQRTSQSALFVVSVLSCIDSDGELGPVWLLSILVVWVVLNRAWREADTCRFTECSNKSEGNKGALDDEAIPHLKNIEISLSGRIFDPLTAGLFHPSKPIRFNTLFRVSEAVIAPNCSKACCCGMSTDDFSLTRPKEEGASAGGKILLVEDVELNRVLLRKFFKDLNLPFEEAENGQVAVDYFKQGKKFDLVFMDKEMPVMDGHEATRQIRLMNGKIPIIALTGNNLPSDRQTFFTAGATEFKTKPLSKEELVQLIVRYGLDRPRCQFRDL